MSRRWTAQRNNRFAVAVLLPLVALGYIAYRFTSSEPNYDLPYAYSPADDLTQQAPGGGASLSRASLGGWGWQQAGSARSARETERLLDELVKVPKEEVGKIAVCAAIHNEARWISEWLLYNRAIGVDRFYLYDTGSTDNTLEVLQPWIEAGTVKLHRFNEDQKLHFQLNSLQTCSRTYASQTDWLLDCDIDEFYVVPHSLSSFSHSRPLLPSDKPDRPLLRLLEDNWLYQTADVIAAARVTWKNGGYKRLPDESSVLVQQNLRDIYHAIPYEKLEYTKSLVHTRQKSGWILPCAHYVKHLTLPAKEAKIITVDGRAIPVQDNNPEAKDEEKGSLYAGQFAGRAFEPLVMYHYVERDLDNCLAKLARAQKVRKGGWRDQAGEEGCKNYELYQPNADWVPVHEEDSFYGGAVKDMTMADSWYGQYLPALIRASHARARKLATKASNPSDESTLPFQPVFVDPHPDLVADWKKAGYGLAWGENPREKEEREEKERAEKEAAGPPADADDKKKKKKVPRKF
ncbi:hypothetical protein JCM8097_001142 [Rhodosporidiobolus ruineniae]